MTGSCTPNAAKLEANVLRRSWSVHLETPESASSAALLLLHPLKQVGVLLSHFVQIDFSGL